MPTFSYNARDIDGRAVTGSMAGPDEHLIREQLRRGNLFVTKVALEGKLEVEPVPSSSYFAKSVKLYEMVIFSRQFSTLIHAGLVLTECLDALEDQTRNETLKATIKMLKTDVVAGSTLTNAVRRHPKIFSELYIALVDAGETGGMLDSTLDQAAEALDKEMEIRERVKSAFIYPIAVLITAFAVVTFLLMFVVPIFAKVYKQFHADLPGITQLLIIISELVKHTWLGGTIGSVAFAVFVVQFNKTYRGRRIIDGILVRLPLFGHLIDKIGLSRAAHTLASLTDAGVPLARVLETAGRVSGNSLLVDAMAYVSAQIQQGRSISGSMIETKRFPLLMTRMVSAGESSGNLSKMLGEVAMFFDREIDYGVKRLITLIEPVMTVGLGFIVGFVLLALYLPVFNMGNVIKSK